MLRLEKTLGWIMICSGLTACSSFRQTESLFPDNRADYKKSTTIQSLEIPPDLLSANLDDQLVVPDIVPNSSTAKLSEYNSERRVSNGTPTTKRLETVLPNFEKVKVQRDGQTRWLTIQAPVEIVWQQVRNFWLESGFVLTTDNQKIGILETEWKENRADIPQDGLRKLLGKALDMLYSAPTRDKFRLRLERGSVSGTSELYLTHRGVEEVAQGENTVWQARQADKELENEMLNRIMIVLGVEEKQARTLLADNAKPQANAELTRNESGGVAQLLLRDNLETAWRKTGLALDRLGFTVEDRDRSKATYFVRYIDPDNNKGQEKGFFSKLFGGSDAIANNQEFQVNLKANAQGSQLFILDKQGNAEASKTAEKMLSLLYEQLK
jgi:outer membrane protein assembly factor BamC